MTPKKQLRAARERLVLAADADRRTIEREFHSGVQQNLVALATTLQLARLAADSDPGAVKALLEEMERDVRRALDEAGLLAQRIYPSALELGVLPALLRSVAVQAGVTATVQVPDGSSYPAEIVMSIYLCWLAMLAGGSDDGRVAINVREAEDALMFELAGPDPEADLGCLQDRVEALGGRLTVEPSPEGGIRLSGLLPLKQTT